MSYDCPPHSMNAMQEDDEEHANALEEDLFGGGLDPIRLLEGMSAHAPDHDPDSALQPYEILARSAAQARTGQAGPSRPSQPDEGDEASPASCLIPLHAAVNHCRWRGQAPLLLPPQEPAPKRKRARKSKAEADIRRAPEALPVLVQAPSAHGSRTHLAGGREEDMAELDAALGLTSRGRRKMKARRQRRCPSASPQRAAIAVSVPASGAFALGTASGAVH